MRLTLLGLFLLMAALAQAEPDTFRLGTGRDGSRRIDSGDIVLNRYARLTANAPSGTRTLEVSDATVVGPGGLVLVHQSTGLTSAPDSGDQRPLPLNVQAVGHFEYARVASTASGVLQLSAPLLHGYAAGRAQVVSVPEFTELEVRSGATLRAKAWDGSTGGILAVLVSQRLRNDGLITVKGAGFRGGTFVTNTGFNGCTELDQPVATGGAYKGEGAIADRFGTASGRGNLANAGGGGNCHNAGGGGGGHVGQGGTGGRSAPVDGQQEAGGLGGAPLVYQPYERLIFGGGGGAGEGNNDVGTGGGAGGGLMLLRANEVRGTGRFLASGDNALATSGDDGAGGGGAGGAISIRTVSELECGTAEASGGRGGDVTELSFPLGPGGGGGGGGVLLQGPRVQCSAKVLAGAPGNSGATGDSHGAGPTSVDGDTVVGLERLLPTAFQAPTAPVLRQPLHGATGVSPWPRIEATAEQGVQAVLLQLDGAWLARVEPDSLGRFTYDVPTALAPGPHELRAVSELLGAHSAFSDPTRFDVGELPADGGTPDGGEADGGTPDAGASDAGASDAGTPGDAGTPDGGADGGADSPGKDRPSWELSVGCGCDATDSGLTGVLALLLGAWVLRQRHAGQGQPRG
jgi:uncharacterized protein (TIGR03382 family)